MKRKGSPRGEKSTFVWNNGADLSDIEKLTLQNQNLIETIFRTKRLNIAGRMIEAEVQFLNSAFRFFIYRSKSETEANAEPPLWAESLLALVLDPKTADAVLGDFSELFGRNVVKYGLRRAKRMYIGQAIRSAMPLIWSAIKRVTFLIVTSVKIIG